MGEEDRRIREEMRGNCAQTIWYKINFQQIEDYITNSLFYCPRENVVYLSNISSCRLSFVSISVETNSNSDRRCSYMYCLFLTKTKLCTDLICTRLRRLLLIFLFNTKTQNRGIDVSYSLTRQQ